MFEEIATGNVELVKAKLYSLREDKKNPAALHTTLTAKNGSGKTVLHAAAEIGNLAIVQTLLAEDVDTDAKDNDGKTPLNIADDKGYGEVAALLRTRGAWSAKSQKQGIEFNRVINLIESSFKAVEEGTNKDLVLMIGNTGAGKSTLINYLMDCEYDLKFADDGSGYVYAETIGNNKEIVEVGSSSGVSKTLYPQVIEKAGLNYVYCDLAGLLDSRGNEERICAASSTQILSRLANRIKAIVLVTDFPSFSTSKAMLFNETAIVLSKILKENYTLIPDSIFLAITKAPLGPRGNITISVDGIVTKWIKSILEDAGGLFDKERKGQLTADEEALMYVLIAFSQHKERILIPNVFDQGQSRLQMESVIKDSIAQATNNFDFVNHDGAQDIFNNILFNLANEFSLRKEQLHIKFPEIIKVEEDIQTQENKLIKQWKDEIKDMEEQKKNPAYDKTRVEQEIATRKARIQTHKTSITTQNAIITQQITQRANLQGLLDTLDTSENVEVWRDTFSRGAEYREVKLAFFNIGTKPVEGQADHHFSYNAGYTLSTSGIANVSGGGFVSQETHGHNFSATFRFNRGENASATVIAFAHKREIPANQRQIASYRSQITACNNAITVANNQIANLDGLVQGLENEIKIREDEMTKGEIDTGVRDGRLDREIAERKNKLIPEAEKRIVDSINKVSFYEKNIQDVKLELKVNESLFKTVYKTIKILELKNDITKEFKKGFKSYYLNAQATSYVGSFFASNNNNNNTPTQATASEEQDAPTFTP